ncbi:MAG: hypothetical protein CML30_00220 [Rhizobiales bacterium]|nr:hypothetical protein [Hyphomicrobiales bacterium]
MRRFHFIGRLGDGDNTSVPVIQRDAEICDIQFVDTFGSLNFGIGDALAILHSLGLKPSESAVDFVIFAAMVTAADTTVSRARNAQNGWTRELDVTIPVADVTLWTAQSGLLARTLRFLTGDHWRLLFRARPAGFEKLVATPEELDLTTFDTVSLFSGGLDSLIGAIDMLSAGSNPLLVSHYWDSVTSKAQKALLHSIGEKFPTKEIRSMRVRLGFDKNHAQTGEKEDSQRGRSLLFFGLATLAASALNRQIEVSVPENGLIGLNVPLDPLRLGALSTRTTHPFYMARVNELLGNLGIPVTLVNPYRHKTKGEMVAECRDLPFLRTVVEYSMSCSSPAKARHKRLSPRHCGTCVPCLIRRASLNAGLGSPDPTLYTLPDLSDHVLNTRRAEGEHVRSFQLMISKLKSDPKAASALARIPGPLNDAPGEIDAYVDVFRRGIDEVGALLEPVKARPE